METVKVQRTSGQSWNALTRHGVSFGRSSSRQRKGGKKIEKIIPRSFHGENFNLESEARY